MIQTSPGCQASRPYISSVTPVHTSRFPRKIGSPADCPRTRCSASRSATEQSLSS